MTLKHPREAERLAALDRYAVLDTEPEQNFDDVVRLVADTFGAPIAAVSLVAEHRQWFKAETGMGVRETSFETSFCAIAILQRDVMVVPDATQDERFVSNPLVVGAPGVRFYAGALLETSEGLPLGALCVLDTKPRPGGATDAQLFLLKTLARQVMSQLELRRAIHERDHALAEQRRVEELHMQALENAVAYARERDARQAQWSAVVNQATAGIGQAESSGQITFANDRFCEIAGRGREELMTLRWQDLTHPDDLEENLALWNNALFGGPSFVIENRVVRPDGKNAWVRKGVNAIRGPDGSFESMVAVWVDVTERQAAEHALRSLNDNLEAEVAERTRERDRVWSNSRDLLAITSADGILREVNPAWTTLLGYAAEDVVGRSYSDFIHPDDVEASRQALGRTMRGPLHNFEGRHLHKDGSARWILWTTTSEGGLVYASGRDITVQRQVEDQLRQSQKMEALGQLTGGIAHDFNNMLATIVGNLDLLKRRAATGSFDRVGHYANAAIAGAQRAAGLTHRLLAFSRRQSLELTAIDVTRLINGMSEVLQRAVGENIRLELKLHADAWTAESDANQLENALLNVTINARDAMAEGGTLTIETSNLALDENDMRRPNDLAAGGYLVIAVSDTGTGMPPAIASKAFDPFFTTKPIGQGTGLGLSMVYGFIKQSRGHVHIDSQPGRGTTVELYLPIHSGTAVDPMLVSDHAPRAVKGEQVLIIEDDSSVRSLVLEVLEDLGYAGLTASDGASALPIIDGNQRLDLLITDVGLPGLNGRQIAEMAQQRRPGLKVLFITGYAQHAAARNGFLAEGMEMITKPFSIDALATRVRTMIER